MTRIRELDAEAGGVSAVFVARVKVERVMGIEPTSKAWEAD
jgi:hypothetical protein